MAALTLRLPDELHDLIRVAAALRRQSVTEYLLAAARGAVLRDGARKATLAAALDRAGRRK